MTSLLFVNSFQDIIVASLMSKVGDIYMHIPEVFIHKPVYGVASVSVDGNSCHIYTLISSSEKWTAIIKYAKAWAYLCAQLQILPPQMLIHFA